MPTGWALWPLIFGSALVMAAIMLPIRCADRGRPYGTRKSGWLAILCIAAIATASTAVSLIVSFLGGLAGRPLNSVTALAIAASTPVITIGGAKLGQKVFAANLRPTENILAIASLLVKRVLDKLDTQMALDQDSWVTKDGWDEDLSREDIEEQAQRLAGTLTRLGKNWPGRDKEVARIELSIARAIAQSYKRHEGERGKNAFKARMGLLELRGRAWVWGYYTHPDVDRAPDEKPDQGNGLG